MIPSLEVPTPSQPLSRRMGERSLAGWLALPTDFRRVVVDANIVVDCAAAFAAGQGEGSDVLSNLLVSGYVICLSNYIRDESVRALWKIHKNMEAPPDGYGSRWRKMQGYLGWVDGWSRFVEPVEVPGNFCGCEDEKDLPVLGTLLASRARVLLTEDKHLRRLVLPNNRQVFSAKALDPEAFAREEGSLVLTTAA